MATTYTTRAKFAKPGPADREWNVPLNANADAIDALAPVGGLCVTPAECPSTSLRLHAAPGRFQRDDGNVGVFGGSMSIAIPPDTTSYIYLTNLGDLIVSASGFPSTSHVPLAIAITDASCVVSVTDLRVVCNTVGSDSRPFLTPAGGTMNDGASLAAGASSGLKIGTSATQKLGFWNAPPVTRPGPYTQAYTATTRSLAPYTQIPLPGSFTGVSSGQAGSPYANISDLNSLRAANENLRVLTENSTQLLNALINDLKAMGLIG